MPSVKLPWLIVIPVCCLSGCSASQPSGESAGRTDIGAQALSPAVSDAPRFRSLDTTHTGINFEIPIDNTHPLKRLYASGFFCGGVAVGDVDGDGLPDIFLVNGPGRNRLYRQISDLRFEDITDRAQVGDDDLWGIGATLVDIDNDGDLDIYLCNYDAANLLYINQGDATFVESAQAFGLDIVDCSLMPAFCDYDRDGKLGLLPADKSLLPRRRDCRST